MRVSYDFHIHTAASPCADENMTPSNIIGLAGILDKQMIAITDHNTCVNCEVAMQVGKSNGTIVIPGMEIECMEEFHVVTLFPSIDAACEIEKQVWRKLPNIPNRKEIFGSQHIFNLEGEVIGEIDRLLLTATMISFEDLVKEVNGVGGIAIPAHIDRTSYSILSNLGIVPQDIEIQVLEVSATADIEYFSDLYKGYRILQGSDAHYLESMCEREYFLDLEVLSKSRLIEFLLNYQ